MKSLILSSLLSFIVVELSFAQVKIKSLNRRFMWIEAQSKYVKARLSNPKDGHSVCWIEVQNDKENFEFIFRRGLPFENCLERIMAIRKIIQNNDRVELIGFASVKDKPGSYYSLWEMIRAKSGCEGYFGDCDLFEKLNDDWKDPQKKIIDLEMYP